MLVYHHQTAAIVTIHVNSPQVGGGTDIDSSGYPYDLVGDSHTFTVGKC